MNAKDPLNALLHEWEAPVPSPRLEARVHEAYRARRKPRLWSRLWSLRISVPAPVLAAAMLLVMAAFWLERRSVPPPAPAPAEAPDGGYLTRLDTAGFQPLPDGEIRLVRSGVER